jgi:Probable addiction module antidote protein
MRPAATSHHKPGYPRGQTFGQRAGGLIMRKTSVYDSAEYLDSPEAIAEYLTDAFESDDTVVITHAIGTAGRARG